MSHTGSISAGLHLAATLGETRPRLVENLKGVEQCPYCATPHPTLNQVWVAGYNGTPRGDGGRPSKWAAYACASCGGVVAAQGDPGDQIGSMGMPKVRAVFPSAAVASPQLPPLARTFLAQAMATLHAPDAAAMVAGSAVDAMLKAKGYTSGSLYARIDKAKDDALLTAGMANWAHSVRLGSNRPRHADLDSPNVSPADAKRSVDFAEALGNFLFVLTAQIEEAVNEVSTPA